MQAQPTLSENDATSPTAESQSPTSPRTGTMRQSQVIRMNSAQLQAILGTIAGLQTNVEELQEDLVLTKEKLKKNQSIIKALWKRQRGSEMTENNTRNSLVMAQPPPESPPKPVKKTRLEIDNDKYKDQRIAKVVNDTIEFGRVDEVWMDAKKSRFHIVFDNGIEEDLTKSEYMRGRSLYSTKRKEDPNATVKVAIDPEGTSIIILQKDLDEARDEVSNLLESAKEQIAESTAQHLQDTREEISKVYETCKENVSNDWKEITKEELSNRNIWKNELSTILEDSKGAIRTELGDAKAELSSMVEASRQEISQSTTKGLGETKEEISIMLDVSKDMMSQLTTESLDNVKAEINQLQQTASQTIAQSAKEAQDNAEDEIDAMRQNAIDTMAKSTKSGLEDAMEQINSQRNDARTEIENLVEKCTIETRNELSKLCNSSTQEIADSMPKARQTISKLVDDSKETISQTANSEIENGRTELSNVVKRGIETIEKEVSELEKARGELSKLLNESTSELTEKVNASKNELSMLADTQTTTIEQSTHQYLEEARDELSQLREKSIQEISSSTEKLLNQSMERISNFTQRPQETTEDNPSKETISTTSAEDTDSQNSKSSKVVEIPPDLDQTRTELSQLVQDGKNELSEATKTGIEEIRTVASEEKKELSGIADASQKAVEEAAVSEIQTIGEKSSKAMADTISKNFASEIEKGQMRLRKTIYKAEALAERLDKLSAAAQTSISSNDVRAQYQAELNSMGSMTNPKPSRPNDISSFVNEITGQPKSAQSMIDDITGGGGNSWSKVQAVTAMTARRPKSPPPSNGDTSFFLMNNSTTQSTEESKEYVPRVYRGFPWD